MSTYLNFLFSRKILSRRDMAFSKERPIILYVIKMQHHIYDLHYFSVLFVSRIRKAFPLFR